MESQRKVEVTQNRNSQSSPTLPPPSRACKGIFSWCCPCRVFLSHKELSVLHSFSLGVLSSPAEGPAPGRELLSCL